MGLIENQSVHGRVQLMIYYIHLITTMYMIIITTTTNDNKTTVDIVYGPKVV